MKQIRAPWRAEYVERAGDGDAECFLCAYSEPGSDSERGILYRWNDWYAVLNAYPYSNGHIMLVLARHHEGFADLEAAECAEFPAALARCETAVRKAYKPHGLNLGVNMGRVAGAGALGHLHIHLVPRWNGDTNFMSTVADTRVLPESLEKSYERLCLTFAELEGS